MRFFNTAGPINPDLHYCLPPLSRFDLNEVMTLIEQQKYFVLHAPRQVGKTSYLLALMDYLNQTGTYHCVYVNVEVAQTAREDVNRGMRAILSELRSMARDYLDDPFVDGIWLEVLETSGGDAALSEVLTRWAQASDKPLVLLIDEIDALVGDTLISILRQLRTGYAKRPIRFPISIVLCGVRDVRDYRIHSNREQAIITGGSAFNIKAESLCMGGFNRQEVERLYQQHTDETAQLFDRGVLEAVWECTHGQPWLVNALGYEVCFRMTTGRDRTLPITIDMILEAKEQLIVRRETHLDQLVDKLQEDRVRRVIHPMLQGEDFDDTVLHDDIRYVIDLGLIRRDEAGLHIANDMYREIIPRELTTIFQLNLESTFRPAWYMAPNGSLDMSQLLTGFQQFFREHSESWLERFDYKEAGPQLLLQAFLQRVVNGGGRIDREYGLGRRRTDLLVIWPFDGGVQRVVIETKLRRGVLRRTLQQGVEQMWGYMDRCGAHEGHLVIFDRDADKAWEEKIFMRDETYRGKTVTVWGM
ncbi:AAA family ATPase [Candidatus Entotheonella palauensis]|nr:AAA-like domain-containing protein [Candidatus Entotheonella palauensis]